MLLKLIQTTFVLLGSLAANADPHWRCISMAHKGHPQMGVSIMVNDIYIYTYAWGPRFPQIILLIIDPNVKSLFRHSEMRIFHILLLRSLMTIVRT